jgi:hypothetical protein
MLYSDYISFQYIGHHVAPNIRKKLALTSLTSGGCSVGIVRLRTEATELLFVIMHKVYIFVYFIFLVLHPFFLLGCVPSYSLLAFLTRKYNVVYKAVHMIISLNTSVDSVEHTILRHLLVMPILYKSSNAKINYLESKIIALLNIPLSFSLIHTGIHLGHCFLTIYTIVSCTNKLTALLFRYTILQIRNSLELLWKELSLKIICECISCSVMEIILKTSV